MSLATASTKTPHRRRRKANVSDKENRGNAFIEVLDDGCVIFQERDTLPDRDNDNQYSLVLAATLLKFRGAVSLVPTALAIFQEHCNLDESVIRCSLFPQRTTGLLHVQDHTAELLSLSRKVIKQATQEGAKDGDKLLLIAVHCLRAIVALKNRDSTVETCIRLLYHCIIAACGEDSLIAIAGFEALHNVLQEYECLSSDGRKVRFSSAPNMWTGAVLPCFVNASSVDGTMTLRQVVTIVLKTCLACLTRTYHHWCEGAPKSTSTLARVEQAAATYGALARRLMQAPPTNEPLHYFLLLMRSSYLSWLSFVADSDDQECIKDLCTHCKSAHHYFWDKAMKLKDTDEVFSSTRKLNDYCLYLRQSAIELLLPVSQSNQGKRLVYEHLWKPACEYAWKAASVHAQQGFSLPVTADSTLAKFHLIIGSKLDSFHVSQHHSVSYVEYCVHRAMHCGISPMFHTYREPHQWKLDPQEEIDMGSLLLSVALLGIRAKYSLTVFCEDVVVEEWCHTSSSFEEWNDYLDQLICHFPSLLLAKWAALPADTHNRYFKLFSALSFHRSIFEVLKTDHRTINRNALQLLARVLSNIIGPLLLLVAKSCQEQSKENYLLETALECYFRPLAAFEVLRETSTGKGNEAHNYEVLANKTIHAMHQAFHMEGRVSTSILEKCAKSISTVARQRTVASNTNACIVPTLYSLTFYTFLSKQLERESKYQLSGRLAHLANALQLSGYYFHAKVVLACVIAEELPDCYNDHLLEWDEIDFLRFLATRSKHMFAPLSSTCQLTKLARSSVRRIISLGNETLYQDNRREPDLEFKGAWDAFLGSCVSKRVFTDLCEANQDNQYISVLLPRVLEWRQQEEKDSRSSSLRLFLLFVDVLIELGASFEGSSEGGEVPWQVEDCLATVKHLKGSLIPLLSSSPGYLGAFVHAVAATALADSKTGDYSKYAFHEDNVSCDDENARFQSSLRLANDALSCFDSSDCQEQNDAMCREVLATIVHHFCWRLEAHQGYEATAKLFHRCQATMELVRKSTQNTNDEIYEFCRSSLLWVLSHFQNQLESIGDSIRSVILMDWILQLLNEDDIDEQSWFRSAAISTFLSSPFSNKNVKFDFKKSLSSCSSGSMEWLAQKELNVATLRARIAFGADCEASSLLELAQSIHQEIQAVVLSQTNLDVLLSWLLSSTKLLFAELAASRGFFAESLQYLQEACRLCLTVISSSRWTSPSHGDVSRWEHIALSTLLLRANRRYIELLGLRSKLHARIGDHRKAIAYLSTLSHFLGADFKHIDKSQGPNVGEILSSEMCLEIKNFRRLNAEITCSATSQDLVLSRLEETGLRWLQSAFTNADDSSLHLQAILDVLSGIV